jgi:hypothetical protein
LLGAVLLAIVTAESIEELHAWSSDHDDVPRLLSPSERGIAIAALHRREAALR